MVSPTNAWGYETWEEAEKKLNQFLCDKAMAFQVMDV
jgi:hypothetical protein